MRVAVVETGYVGLVTGTCFAEMGNTVWCVDVNKEKIEKLKNGIIPIYEPGLSEMVERNYTAKSLHFTTDIAEALEDSNIAFIAVGTPMGEDGSADLQYVLSVVQALKGEDITIYGDGTQTRSFCYVDDLVEGMIRMMNSRDGFTGPVNLGNPGEFTMLELAEKVISLTGSKSNIIHKELPADDPTQRKPVIELAKKELDWEPSIALDEGLKKTIDYFRGVV